MTANNLVKDNECVDDLQRNGLHIIQDNEGFKFGMDAVLLSGYAIVHKGERVLDLCSGNGIIPLLLYAKTELEHVSGLEIQQDVADMAMRSVEYNAVTDTKIREKVDIICGDVKEAVDIFGKEAADVITCNPPYMKGGHGLTNSDDSKMIARHEIRLTLEELMGAAGALLKQNGRMYMVHRPFRLTEIIEALHKNKMEAKRMRFVYPFMDKEPNMVLIEAIKGGKPYLSVEKPLVVYKEKGVYTEEITETYGY